MTANLQAQQFPPGVRFVKPDEGLLLLPETSFLMLKAKQARQPHTGMLAEQIRHVFGKAAA